MSAFALQLPGKLRADLLAMTPAQAFKAAGGELPRTGSYEWHGPDSLLWSGAVIPPLKLEGMLETITMQLAAAPAELWQA